MSGMLSNFCSANWNKELQAEERGNRGHFAISISKEKQEPVGNFVMALQGRLSLGLHKV